MKTSAFFRNLTLGCFLSAILPVISNAQNGPAKQWDKTFGGSGSDRLQSLVQTSDGGYILGGWSDSGASSVKSQASKGSSDYWIIKVDALGNKQWDKTYGGNQADNLTVIRQTSDGGFILGGHSDSGISGDKSQPSQGNNDFWIIKLDGIGNIVWERTFGGAFMDELLDLRQTVDGGFILGGSSYSELSGDKSQASNGGTDFWVVKLDANGNKVWDKAFGGNLNDNLEAIHQTSDGGYIVGGRSESGVSGDKSQASKGDKDFWIIKLDNNGIRIWDKTFGGSNHDGLTSLEQTSDGSYILGGHSFSGISGDKSQISQGNADFWIIKINGVGSKIWDKTFGGSGLDALYDLKQTPDGGFILIGDSDSGFNSDKSQAPQGSVDFWVVKLSANGTKVWDKTIGGINDDFLETVDLTNDGGYLLGGWSDSGISGDKTQGSYSVYHDYWIVKLAPDVLGTTEGTSMPKIQLFQNQPNPFSHNTSMAFSLTQPEEVTLTVYNSLGQTVAKQQKKYGVGQHQLQWQELVQNQKLKAGTYFYQLTADGFQDTKRMILLNE